MSVDIQFYKKRLKLPENAQFTRIAHDDAMVATLYKVVCSDRAYALKICDRPNDYRREVYFLQYFSDILPVPRIVDVVRPEKSLDGAILMEYVLGDIPARKQITQPLAHQIGMLLAQIHTHRMQGFGDLTEPHNLTHDPRIYFAEKFYEGIDECAGHLPASLLENCCAYLESHAALLTAVDGPCIIHRDFRPANLIVFDGQVRGIIDWSSARAGFAQDDFCSIEHGGWLSDAYKAAFLAGYASVRPVPEYASLTPLLRLNRAIAFIGFVVKRDMWRGQAMHAGPYRFNRAFLDGFFS